MMLSVENKVWLEWERCYISQLKAPSLYHLTSISLFFVLQMHLVAAQSCFTLANISSFG
jgi:hypothetical protein